MPLFVYTGDDVTALAAKDKKLARAMERIGRIDREVQPDIFAALIESIIGQQISGKAASTIKQRLTDLCGGHITAQAIAAQTAEAIQQCGMSHRKVSYVKSAAEAVISGEIDVAHLAEMDDDELIAKLTKLPGIGVWTAEMLMIFSLQHKNVFSFGDLAIKRGLCKLYGHKEITQAVI